MHSTGTDTDLLERYDTIADKANAVVVAAQRALDAVEQERILGNAALSPAFVDSIGAAQRRLADAKIDVAADRAARVRAAAELVAQCTEILRVLNLRKGQDVALTQIRTGEYYLASAEYLLAKMKAGA